MLSEGSYSEEELGSLAVNLGSLHQNQGSDTEGDFLDKCDIKNRNKSRVEEGSVNPEHHRDNTKVRHFYTTITISAALQHLPFINT